MSVHEKLDGGDPAMIVVKDLHQGREIARRISQVAQSCQSTRIRVELRQCIQSGRVVAGSACLASQSFWYYYFIFKKISVLCKF